MAPLEGVAGGRGRHGLRGRQLRPRGESWLEGVGAAEVDQLASQAGVIRVKEEARALLIRCHSNRGGKDFVSDI